MRGNDRERNCLLRLIDEEKVPGHWIWTGKVNFFGAPVLPGHAQMLVSAARTVYHLFKGTVMPEGATRQCQHELCVRPGCFEVPKKRKAQQERTGAPLKTRCAHGHDLTVHRRRDASGRAFCSECARVKSRARWEREKREREELTARKQLCKHGHDLAVTRRRWPCGDAYCSECQQVQYEKRTQKRREAARRRGPAYPVDVIRNFYHPRMTPAEARELVWAKFPNAHPDNIRKALRTVKREHGDRDDPEYRPAIANLVRELYTPGMSLDEMRTHVWRFLPEADPNSIGKALRRHKEKIRER